MLNIHTGLLTGSRQSEWNFSNVQVALASRDGCDPPAALAASSQEAGRTWSCGESRGHGSPWGRGASPGGGCRPPALFAAPAPDVHPRVVFAVPARGPLALKLLITEGAQPRRSSDLLFLLGEMEVYGIPLKHQPCPCFSVDMISRIIKSLRKSSTTAMVPLREGWLQ